MFDQVDPALCAVAVFALNPNMLYLQSTPMTEPVLMATLMGLLYFTVLFGCRRTLWAATGAGVFSLASTLTRYDGWFLLPIVALYLFLSGGEKRWKATILFCAIAGVGPIYWLAHNYIFEGDALAFYRGPWSARAIQGDRDYPGRHDAREAAEYYLAAVRHCAGSVLMWMGGLGVLLALWKRAWWGVALLIAIPAFYILSVYSSGTPIFVPDLWPNSYYNTRYGIGALPLLAVGAAAIVAVAPTRLTNVATGLVVLAAISPWILNPHMDNWITWKESQVNSDVRRAWTSTIAGVLKSEYRPGAGVLFTWGDLTGALREARVPLRETLHIGNGWQFEGAIARPDLFLREEWVIAVSADPVASALTKTWRSGPQYDQVATVYVPGGPVIEIHRRTHDHTLLKGPRRPE
jgi:hypothetical protein